MEVSHAASDESDYLITDHGADVLMISFGGFHEGFNFVGLGERLGVDGLFLRDRNLDWYLGGVRGIGTDLPAVSRFLREVIGIRPRRRVLCIGQSSGGYAALRFGLEVAPDAVLAFSPQTRPVAPGRIGTGPLEGIEVSRPDDRIADLGRLYRARQPSFRIQVHLCETELDNPTVAYFWDDWYHLDGLDGIGALEVVRHPCTFHPVARHLDGIGALDAVVGRLLA